MKRLARATVAAVTILGLGVPGIVGATSSITTSGPDARTTVRTTNENDMNVQNSNGINVGANATQRADSGEVTSHRNTGAGEAMSGDAENSNAVAGDISVDNSGASGAAWGGSSMGTDSSMGDITTSGPDSRTDVTVRNSNDVRVTNTNNLTVSSSVNQTSTSGDVQVSRNTEAGNASSGSVSNTSSTAFTVSVTN